METLKAMCERYVVAEAARVHAQNAFITAKVEADNCVRRVESIAAELVKHVGLNVPEKFVLIGQSVVHITRETVRVCKLADQR